MIQCGRDHAIDHFHRAAKRLSRPSKDRQGSQGVDPSQVRRAGWCLVRHGQPLGESGSRAPTISPGHASVELESSVDGAAPDLSPSEDIPPVSGLDFSADPDAVSAVAEAHRLAYGHLFNRAFATETSLIDPLPHQRIAVYQRMLEQSPLRFLLADDAGAGKTIMTGLYVREMLSRRLIRRVLIVPPAGLVGNWQREMRDLFRMQISHRRWEGRARRQSVHRRGRRPSDSEPGYSGRAAHVQPSRRCGDRALRSRRLRRGAQVVR